jgi:hypothetical protein
MAVVSGDALSLLIMDMDTVDRQVVSLMIDPAAPVESVGLVGAYVHPIGLPRFPSIDEATAQPVYSFCW